MMFVSHHAGVSQHVGRDVRHISSAVRIHCEIQYHAEFTKRHIRILVNVSIVMLKLDAQNFSIPPSQGSSTFRTPRFLP
jgi:hypothetical protein